MNDTDLKRYAASVAEQMAEVFNRRHGHPLPETQVEFAGMLAIAFMLGRDSKARETERRLRLVGVSTPAEACNPIALRLHEMGLQLEGAGLDEIIAAIGVAEREIERLHQEEREAQAARLVITELVALIPLKDQLHAAITGRTLVDYFRQRLSEPDDGQLREHRRTIAALVAAAGGRVEIPAAVLVKLDPNAEIENGYVPESGAHVLTLKGRT